MSVLAIIVAAGQGSRLGGDLPKQFQSLQGKPVLCHTLKKFECCAVISDIIIVASEAWSGYIATEIVDQFEIQKVVKIVNGGAERQDSVFAGLIAAPHQPEIVLIHDAVRPFVSAEKITECVEAAAGYGAAVLAVPPRDTVKAGNDGFVASTPDRKSLWAVQTPQAFKYNIIKAAFDRARKAGFYSTDDSALVERTGQPVKIVAGSPENIKITVPFDMKIAELLLAEDPCG